MLDGISVIGLTPAGLLLATVVLILTGRLVPRRIFQDKVEECERWRLAYEAERTARSLSDSQTRELLEVARTGQHLMSAVFQTSEEIKSGEA